MELAAGVTSVWQSLGSIFSYLGIFEEFTRAVSMGIDPLLTLMGLALAGDTSTGVLVFLGITVISKILLTSFRGSKILCDAFIGQAEDIVGLVAVVGVGILGSPAVTAYAVSAPATAAGAEAIASQLGSVLVSLGGGAVYYAVRMLSKGVDAMGFLYALFPGGLMLFSWVRYGLSVSYVIISMLLPHVAVVLGVIILIAAILIFGKSYRMQTYFRRIYTVPLLRLIFMRSKQWPLIMSKPYRYLLEKYPEMKLCQEAFVLRGVGRLRKRQRVYLVNSGGKNYLCRKPFLRKWEVTEFPLENFYGEKRLRFFLLYSKEGGSSLRPQAALVLRRELNKRYGEIKTICGFQTPPEKADSKKYRTLMSYSEEASLS